MKKKEKIKNKKFTRKAIQKKKVLNIIKTKNIIKGITMK